MILIERVFAFFAVFFAVLSVIGLYLGFSGNLSFLPSIFSVIFSAIIALIVSFKCNAKSVKEKKLLIALLAVFALFLFSVSMPGLVFNATTSDFMNHSRTVRLLAKFGSFAFTENNVVIAGNDSIMKPLMPLVFTHQYPQQYYSVATQIYFLFQNAYVVNTVLSILMLLFSMLAVFLVAREFFPEKTAIIAAFLFSFSITILWSLEAGFLPQIFSTFFFIASVYYYKKKNFLLLLVSNIGLFSYTPFAALFAVFLVIDSLSLKSFKNSLFKKWKSFLAFFLSFLIIFPDTFGLFSNWFLTSANTPYMLLIRGGIPVPNFFSLLALIPAVLVFLLFLKKAKNNDGLSFFFKLGLSIFLVIALSAGYFAANSVFSIVPIKQVHQLYMAVKIFYILLFPISVFAAAGIATALKTEGRWKKFLPLIAIILLAFHLAYFAGYSMHLKERQTFPPEVYSIAERLGNIEGPFTLGFPECFVSFEEKSPQFYYASLFDNPSTSDITSRELQLNRLFQFNWARQTGSGKYRIQDSEGLQVLKPEDLNVDYFITDCSMLEKPVLLQEGSVRVYQMR